MIHDPLLRDMQYRLSQAQESLVRLLNHLPGTAYRCRVSSGFQYRLVFLSKGAESMFGMAAQDMVNTNSNIIESLMSEDERTLVRRTMQEALLARQPYEMFYRITLKSTGESKWIWDQGEGVFDFHGNCRFIEGIMMDVTEQKNKEWHLWQENELLRSSIKNSYGLGDIVGKSDAMQGCYKLLLRAAHSDTNVVLYGETGVGKDLAARTIHEISGVKGRFVPVNCAAIPEQLLESEFFGHVKGAFSGAVSNHPGHLAVANNGTLFLDEVGELPFKLQGKLLRAIESKTYTPVGSSEVKLSSFRLISATNRDLQELVRDREMRADFYYRIHVLSITLPPLRERLGDIPLLVDAYAKERGHGKRLPPALLLAMEQYGWPGNIRELQNALDRYWAFGDMGLELGGLAREIVYLPGPADSSAPAAAPLSSAKEELEKQRIRATLDQHGWKKGKTAEALGITTRTLQRKLKRYGISRQSR